MADDELFGKIDALLGRRAGLATFNPDVADEFPMLTDVVAEGTWDIPSPPVDALSSPNAEVPEPDLMASEDGQLSDADIDRLAAAVETRLSKLFADQKPAIEALVRRIVREELDAHRD